MVATMKVWWLFHCLNLNLMLKVDSEISRIIIACSAKQLIETFDLLTTFLYCNKLLIL